MEVRDDEGQQQRGDRGERPGRRARVLDAALLLAGLALIVAGLLAMARGATLISLAGC